MANINKNLDKISIFQGFNIDRQMLPNALQTGPPPHLGPSLNTLSRFFPGSNTAAPLLFYLSRTE